MTARKAKALFKKLHREDSILKRNPYRNGSNYSNDIVEIELEQARKDLLNFLHQVRESQCEYDKDVWNYIYGHLMWAYPRIYEIEGLTRAQGLDVGRIFLISYLNMLAQMIEPSP